MKRRHLFFLAAAMFAMPASQATANEQVRVATLASGTVAWEIDTIIKNGLDKKHGIDLTLVPVAGKQGADIMLQGGDADVIVTDWIWVSRQRNAGADYTFRPYSKQVGGIVVPDTSPIKVLADLKGKKIGIAGGPTDKSWILFQALALKNFNLDLAKEAEPVFAAPPLLSEKLESGEIDAVITFWNFAAKLKAHGGREIAKVADAAQALGLDASTPLLGYVYSEKWSEDHGGAADGLLAASAEAKALLASDDKEWERLKPMMKINDDAELEALKVGFRAGIPGADPVNVDAAEKVFAVLAAIGGKDLVGDGATLAPGTFTQAGAP
jgi:NitT/TauT family transport system substrate-binding protein